MEIFYSCGCVTNCTDHKMFCETHGRKQIAHVEKTDKKYRNAAYRSIEISYCLATELETLWDSYDLIVIDSPTKLIKKLPIVPIFVVGQFPRALESISLINHKKQELNQTGHIYFNAEFDEGQIQFILPYFFYNCTVKMSRYPYLGVTGLLFDYILMQLNTKHVLHLGVRNPLLARMCMLRNIRYTGQTSKLSVYESMSTYERLNKFKTTERGQL